MRKSNFKPLLAAMPLFFACIAPEALFSQTEAPAQPVHINPDGKGNTTRNTPSRYDTANVSAPDPIWYHGGPVMLLNTHLYYIWYGNWSPSNFTVEILTDFANGLGGSPYFSINTTYTDLFGRGVPNSVTFAGSMYDNYSKGKHLSDSDILNIVMAKQPYDPAGIYVVLTSGDVDQAGSSGTFGGKYCGWHNHSFQFFSFSDIKYAFVGSPDRFESCISQDYLSPNQNPMADSMASVVAHELSESVTDPDLNAWADSKGNENADKCAWNFGQEYRVANGSMANVRIGDRDFLIQQNWVNANPGYCALNLGNQAKGNTMNPGEAIYPGQSVRSLDGRYVLILQPDGNLVLYRPGGFALWSSKTVDQPTDVSVMQTDGNFVSYASGLKANWASHTSKNPGSRLIVQNDGNVVIYRPDGSAIWATNTVQP